MNINNIPKEMGIEMWMYVYKNFGIAFYESKDEEPKFYNWTKKCKLKTKFYKEE